MSLLYYKRPDYVEKRSEPMAACDYRTYLERQRASIPPELCFEYVISNRAVPVSLISPFSPLPFFFSFPFSFPFFFSLFFSLFLFPFPLASSVFEVVEKWQKSLTSGLLCPFTSHVHYMILPAIYYTSRTMRRTCSSTCGFRIIRNASSKPSAQPIRRFRRHGMRKAAS